MCQCNRWNPSFWSSPVQHVMSDGDFSAALTDPNAAAAQQAVLQQQLSLLTYSPYGDSPLFRNQLSDPKKKEEVT